MVVTSPLDNRCVVVDFQVVMPLDGISASFSDTCTVVDLRLDGCVFLDSTDFDICAVSDVANDTDCRDDSASTDHD